MANIQGIINVNSGYSVTSTDALLDSSLIKVWIYEGVQGNQPAVLLGDGGRPPLPTYSLSATSVNIGGTPTTSFQLAPLVEDYLESVIASGVYQSASIWVDYQVINVIDNATSIEPSMQLLAVDGYVYTSDTDDGSGKGLRLSNREILNLKGELFSIPVLKNNLVRYAFKNEGTTISEGTVGSSNVSDNQIVYLTNSLDGVTPFDCDEVVITHATGDITTNGSFETNSGWTLENDFTISTGAAYLASDDESISRLFQAQDVLGEDFEVAFEISNYSGGGDARMQYPFSVAFNGNGFYTGTGTGLFDRIQFQGTSTTLESPLAFTIDNVSVYPLANIVNATIKITNIEECKYDPRKLTFVNKCGALQDVWMFKNSKRTVEVKSDTWNRMNPLTGGSIERASKVKHNLQGNEKFVLNSGFYPENNNTVFEQLLQSESVWLWTLEDTPRAQAVIIKDSSLEIKNSITDKGINYTITAELAYNKYRSL